MIRKTILQKNATWIDDTRNVLTRLKGMGYTVQRPVHARKTGQRVFGSSFHNPEEKRIFIEKVKGRKGTPVVNLIHEGSHAFTYKGEKPISIFTAMKNPELKKQKIQSEINAHREALKNIKTPELRKQYLDVARENMKGYKAL